MRECRGDERQLRTVVDMLVVKMLDFDVTEIETTQSRSKTANIFLTVVSPAGRNPRIQLTITGHH